MAFLGFGSKKDPANPASQQSNSPSQFSQQFSQQAPQAQAPPMQEPPNVSDPVIQEIQRLQQQGLSNSQIVQQLQRQGYKTYQIFDGFNTIDLMGKVGPDQNVPLDPALAAEQMPIGAPQIGSGSMPPQMQQSYASQPAQQSQDLQYDSSGQQFQQMPSEQAINDEQIEELVEAIVEEKWEELVKSVNKIIAWKNAMESRLVVLEQRVADLKSQSDDTNRKVLEKMGEYDKNVMNVVAEVRTMEQIFQKVLPTFTENLNEMSRITKQMKQSSGVKDSISKK